ncbi:MAG: fimbrial protein [Ottowia sp.]|uniref:fimbrial protein n=1 Tax=Ottowia sp. TaxID=1898956 RepID=UPI003C73FD98
MRVDILNSCGNGDLHYNITIQPGSQILVGTCLVTTPSVSVTLPPVRAREFTGAGVTKGDTPLRIGLNCTPGANVYITLTDSTNPGNRTDRLTPAASSTAGGIAMRLLHNGTPVAYGPDSDAAGTVNQWLVGASDSLTEVPLSAQYISTGTVTPGVVKGIATFTMSYQ